MTAIEIKALANKVKGDVIVLSNGALFHFTDQGLKLARAHAKKFKLTIHFVKKNNPKKTEK